MAHSHLTGNGCMTGKTLLCAGLAGLLTLFTLAPANADTWASAQTPPDKAFQTVSGTATDSSMQGPIQTLTYSVTNNMIGTLSPIAIQEQTVGALRAVAGGNLISLVIDDWLQFDPQVVPTVTVSKTDGTLLEGRISPPERSHFSSVEGTSRLNEKRTFDIRLLIASDATTGPYTITISDLSVATIITPSNQGSPIGDYSLTVTGNNNRQPGGTLSTADLADGSNVGARPTQQSFRVLKIIRAADGDTPSGYVTTSGPITAQTVTGVFARAGTSVDKWGSTFLFGFIPEGSALAPSTVWTFDADRNWHLFTNCDTATPYYRGPSKNLIDIPLVAEPADLTALIGAQVYVGQSISDSPVSAEAACIEMLEQARYRLIHSVGQP